ncbi:MAG: DUF3426 domain-containing protein [Ectothiorhodospiraceae bacterium]
MAGTVPDASADLSRVELEDGSSAGDSRRLRQLGWLAANALLILVLGLQAAYIKRDALAAEPRWRPWVAGLCAVSGCELPLLRAADQMQMVRGRVTEHPQLDGALVATGGIANRAEFRQPYPLMRLQLLDGNRNISGERWFHPRDYLDRNRDWRAGIPTETTVRVRLVLSDPGSGARQYIFDLR